MPATLDLEKMTAKLKELLKMDGPIDEGTEGSLNSLGSGVKKNYLTYPKEPEVIVTGEGVGNIRYPYDCRKKTEVYTAGIQTSVEHSQHPAIVTADYEFTLRGKVLINNVSIDGNQSGRCANSIIKRVKDLNGQELE